MKLNLIPQVEINKKICQICVQAKLPRQPFKSVDRLWFTRLVHSNVCDTSRVSRGGNKYFVTFIDNFSKYCYVYLMKTKNELLNKFKVYKAEAENQTQ